ncbi:MAG: T9SS type A sorting domain-containing protein [Bacteroidia bacterium]|jgi:hypothetical protein|nr:T9SS type A sorting domain-containing protein [Bacteroidia bacterium]
MKISLFLLAGLALCSTGYAQSITPVTSSEYCPATTYTFTVTLSGNVLASANDIAAEGSASGLIAPAIATSGTYNFLFNQNTNQTSFSFTGRFQDLNRTQRFIIRNTRLGTTLATFDYNRIRSLDVGNLQTIPNPSVTSPIQVAPCQISTFNITFPQVTYLNTSSSPAAVFGSVSNYEYLIPAGWKVDNITSDGVTWIRRNNNVDIQSDLASGNGGQIRIRAVNACATPQLVLKTGAPRILTISRPRPALTFTGATPLCSTATYTASNIPAPFTNYLWEISSTQIGTITSPTSASTQIVAGTGGTGSLSFTINGGASCPLNYTYNTFDILGQSQMESGTPQTSWPEPVIAVPGSTCIPMGYNVTYQSNTPYQYLYYRWGYYDGPSSNGGPLVVVNPAGGPSQPIRILNTQTVNRISVAVGNQCGLGVEYIREITFDAGCNWGGDVEYRLAAPAETGLAATLLTNPVKDMLTLNIPEGAESEVMLRIVSLNGQVVKEFAGYGTVMNVDVSTLAEGVYIAEYTCKGVAGRLKFVKE